MANENNECPTCQGTGEVFEDRCARGSEHYTVQVECDECGGEGTVESDDSDEEHPFAALASTETDDRLAKAGA